MISQGIVYGVLLHSDTASALWPVLACSILGIANKDYRLVTDKVFNQAAADRNNLSGQPEEDPGFFPDPIESSTEKELIRGDAGSPIDAGASQTSNVRELETESCELAHLPGTSIFTLPGLRIGRLAIWSEDLKRAFDVVTAMTAIFVFAPLFIVLALLVYLDNPGPVFYPHRRIGRGGRGFFCYKFRTMSVNADRILENILANDSAARSEWFRSQKLQFDPRVTRVGRILRRASLDELPQLINIFKGEMSLVGPRPIISDESKRYGRYIHVYSSVTPGITGLWQVSGGNKTTYRRRVAADVYYAKNISLQLDLFILLKTFPVVALGQGQP